MENLAFMRSGVGGDPDDPRPDVMFVFMSGHMGTDGGRSLVDGMNLVEDQVVYT